MFLKVQYTFIKTINGKSINWNPTGYTTYLPSGDKTFSRFENLKKLNEFLKVQYTFTKTTINGKSINWTPTGYTTYLPSGDKTAVRSCTKQYFAARSENSHLEEKQQQPLENC